MWSNELGVKNHPDKAVASPVCNLFNDNFLPNLRQIIKKQQKQTTLDKFFSECMSSDSKAHLIDKKLKKVTPE